MALPDAPADITLTMVAAELEIDLPLQLGDARVRALAGKSEGAISLGDLRGKSAYTPPTITNAGIASGHTDAPNGDLVAAGATCDFTIHGGEAPFTINWTRVSGSALIGASGAPPSFGADGVSPWSYSAVFKATVTDARSNQATSTNISVMLSAGAPI